MSAPSSAPQVAEGGYADATGSKVPAATPALFHRMRHNASILALAVSREYIFAGTQGGEILVYSLDTYEKKATIEGHKGSVLGLTLSAEQDLLFSTAGDRILNVWSTSTLTHLYSLYSTHDVGDIFCAAYSSSLQTLYLGAQNTSIQWYDLKEKDVRPLPALHTHPSYRADRFFDSSGPGGHRTPRPQEPKKPRDAKGGRLLEIDKSYTHPFAHFGYVYCMLLARGILQEELLDPQESGSDEVLISGGGDGAIKIWGLDGRNGGRMYEVCCLEDEKQEGESVLSLALDGTFLYAGRLEGEVNVWDLETKQLVRRLNTDGGDVLTLSVGGGFLFAGGENGCVEKFGRMYERVTGFRAHEGLVLASAFTVHKGTPVFVTGGNDDTVAVWDVRDCSTNAAANKATSNEHLFESLKKFVSYRTVSSDPRYRGDCRRGASYLRSVFKNFGAATTEMLNTEEPYNPIVYAHFRANRATSGPRRRILFYGHYDVIAAENDQGNWIVDPFSLEGIDGYLYGRGVSDNKGPIMAAIYAVTDLIATQALESDIVFLIEGEEECGSRGFERAVRENKALIGDVDWILLANSYWLDDHVPCLTYGLRGVIHATVEISSPHPDLHSGVDGSALLDESLKDLVMLLAKLTGKHGHVSLPGFYDPILPLSAEEASLYDDITATLLARNPALGPADALANSLMRRWREASLTIHRFTTSGPENSTIIPRLARAALSLRLVPNQTAGQVAAQLTAFLQREFAALESKNRLAVTIDHIAEPWLGDLNNEIFRTLEEGIMHVWGPVRGVDHHQHAGVRRRSSAVPGGTHTEAEAGSIPSPSPSAAENPPTSSTLANGGAVTPVSETGSDDSTDTLTPPEATPTLAPPAAAAAASSGSDASWAASRKPLYIREGGSIPSIRFLEKAFGAPAAQLPVGQASDAAHLDNERLRLVNLYKAKGVFGWVFGGGGGRVERDGGEGR